MSFQQYNQYPAISQCRLVATSNQSGTYQNGPLNNGVGATFTYATGALTIDSVTVNVGDRILFQAQSSQNQNGIYVCVVAGATGVAAILQRASDQQCIEQIKAGQYVSIGAGTAHGGSLYTVIEPLPSQFGISNLLLNATITTGLGTAAAKSVTDNTKSSVASVSGSFTIGNFVSAEDTSGTIQDSGFNSNNLLLIASASLTAAQFNGMYATPVQLVAAPGAGKMIIIHRMELVMTFGTTQFAAGGVVAAQYGNTVHGGGVLASNSEQASDFTGAAATTIFVFNGASGNGSQALASSAVNAGIFLSNASGAFTTGDSTFVVSVYYQVILA